MLPIARTGSAYPAAPIDNRGMKATFVYDGDCAFCSSCARLAQRWVPTSAAIVAWQRADLTGLGLTEAECEQAVQWATPQTVGAPLAGPDAIAALLRSSRRRAWRVAGRLLGLRPVRRAAWPAYRWVARNRHRLPGGTPACALPAAGVPAQVPAQGPAQVGGEQA